MHLELMSLRRTEKPLPEGGPVDDERFNHPPLPVIKLTDDQIMAHIKKCLDGSLDTAFGRDRNFWSRDLRDLIVEALETISDDELFTKPIGNEPRLYHRKMAVADVRKWFKDQEIPLEYLEEEGLI